VRGGFVVLWATVVRGLPDAFVGNVLFLTAFTEPCLEFLTSAGNLLDGGYTQ
jgi:hypothetical protein